MKSGFKGIIACIAFLAFFVASCSKDSPSPDDGNPDPGGNNGGGEQVLILPQKEVRGAWITTAYALDWPRTPDYDSTEYGAAAQQANYKMMLDMLKSKGFNTVFVQVRGMGDAFYNSPYEPWSAYITGTRGNDPGYDVMKFLIDEAHARGLEFHAWINPYRIATRSTSSTPYPALHPSINSNWVVDHEKIQIYNPALPEVRQRLMDIVKDIITKYNVDGLHMDDYFYPDPSSAGVMVSDQPLYDQYGSGFATITDWRRDNVNKAIEGIYSTIVQHKPEVVFSISPAASRTYNLNTLYADVGKWCQEGWVDMLIPQLYQEIGNPYNDFQTNLSTWAQYAYDARLVIGHALYKFGDANYPAFNSTQELVRQFDLAKRNPKASGSVMYRTRDVYDNRIGIADKLAELYSHKAIIPFAGRKIASVTNTPTNVKFTGNELSWSAASGSNVRYAVYHFADLKKEGKLVDVVTTTKLNVSEPGHYSVTSLNQDHLESEPSDPVEKK